MDAKAEEVQFTKEEALAAAEAEGLALCPSQTSSCGYLGISFSAAKEKGGAVSKKPYSASLMGKSLGNYAVPEHAALVRARAMGPEASHRAAKEEEAKIAATQAAPLTKEEALAAAEAEGLTMVPGNCISGYKYVSQSGPRFALGSHSGMDTRKRFNTPEEAALVYARSLGVEGSKTETEAMIHENPALAMPIAKRQKLSE